MDRAETAVQAAMAKLEAEFRNLLAVSGTALTFRPPHPLLGFAGATGDLLFSSSRIQSLRASGKTVRGVVSMVKKSVGDLTGSGGHQHQEAAHHVSDEPADGGEERHRFRPHVPAFVKSHIHGHDHQSEGGSGPDLSSKPSVKVSCQADTNHMLAIRDGKVILARSDPNDPTQVCNFLQFRIFRVLVCVF